MNAGDLLELLNNEVTSSRSTSTVDIHDVELLYGRNETTGERGSFFAKSVYVLPTIDKPTPDFIVSTRRQFLSVTTCKSTMYNVNA